jgi:hypothetical protein
VQHADWGQGAVQRCDGDEIAVLFDLVGYETLAMSFVVERGLLTLSG